MRQATRDRVKALWDEAEKRVQDDDYPKFAVTPSVVYVDSAGDAIEIGERYLIEGIDEIVEFDGNYLVNDDGEHFTYYLEQPKKLKKILDTTG